MSDSTEELREVAIPRITVADTADLLREYERELKRSGVENDYAERVTETIADLDATLDKGN